MENSFYYQPKVSIITICYNSEKTIETAIKSVLNQSYPNVEYIIIDGGSSDGTKEIIKKFDSHITNWISERDAGIYDAFNKGIGLASGDVIGIVNSDDFLEPNAIAQVAEAFQRNIDADVVYGKVRIIDETNSIQYVLGQGGDLYARRYLMMPVPHPSTFITKRSYEQLGNYKTEFPIASDYELILRFMSKQLKFLFIDTVLSNMRIGGISTTNYVRTFYEHAVIKQIYGCSKIKALFLFAQSCAKTFVVHTLSKFSAFSKWYEKYKHLKQ